MIMSQEQALLKAQAQFQQLLDSVQSGRRAGTSGPIRSNAT